MRKTWILWSLLLLSSLLSLLYPKPVNSVPALNLSQVIPQHFGDWQTISEQQQGHTLQRIYRNSQRQLLLLSISWQNNTLSENEQSHRPEYCYQAQGFTIKESWRSELKTSYGTLPLQQLIAQKQQYYQYVSYWLTIGQYPTLPGVERKLRQLQFMLTRQAHDGLTIRLATPELAPLDQARLHQGFIEALLTSLSPELRKRFIA